MIIHLQRWTVFINGIRESQVRRSVMYVAIVHSSMMFVKRSCFFLFSFEVFFLRISNALSVRDCRKLNGIRTHDLCDTAAAIKPTGDWELFATWVRNVPIRGGDIKDDVLFNTWSMISLVLDSSPSVYIYEIFWWQFRSLGVVGE